MTDEPEEPAEASHDDLGERIAPRQTVHTELVNAGPGDPLRDMLGVHRPDARPVNDLEDDLRAQANRQERLAAAPEHEKRAGWVETVAGWTDLCALHAWFHDRPLYESDAQTSAFDALAGLFGDDALDTAWSVAPLPLPYEGLTFREGDHDSTDSTAARYENAPARGSTDLVALLQEDCKRLGFSWGHPRAGHYGYIRFRSSGSAHWDGVRDTRRRAVPASARGDIIAGHTALAIREIQVCMDYPFGVFERLDHEPRLANRPYPIEGFDPKAGMGVNLEGRICRPRNLPGSASRSMDGRSRARCGRSSGCVSVGDAVP